MPVEIYQIYEKSVFSILATFWLLLFYNFQKAWSTEEKFQIQQKLDEAEKYLHMKNIYVTRLRAALLHINGSLEENLLFVQKSVYENYRL